MDSIWMSFTWIAVFCVFLCTLMFSIWGCRFRFKYRIFNIITSPYWLCYLFLLVPMVIRNCRRCQADVRPWVAFEQGYYRFDIYEAIFSASSIIICELWLLWIPSHIYITSLPLDKRENAIFIRLSNILLGILILFFQLNNCGYTL
jgi:formate hydrogenlyase subunit 3/multisubunit Na+/H+ antiporter MnhD subunit